MLKPIVLLIIALVSSGCASTYTPSNKMLQLKQDMDKQAAVAVLARYTRPSPGNGGYCGGNKFFFDAGTPLVITQDGYSLRTYKRGDLVSKEQVGNVTRYTYKKVYYEDGLKFSGITKIRVMPGGPTFGNCSNASAAGFYLSLYFSTIDLDAIGVSEAGLDEVLAALSVLAPQAQLIQGVGL